LVRPITAATGHIGWLPRPAAAATLRTRNDSLINGFMEIERARCRGMFELPQRTVNLKSRSRSTITRLLAQSWQGLAALLAPPVCALCGAEGRAAGAGVAALDLCGHCHAALPPSLERSALPGGEVWALCAYDYPADYMIRALKFHGERVYGRVLGTLLGELRASSAGPLPEVVVPIPLHRHRFAERGYNQAAELARHAARVLHVPLRERLLQRPQATLEQSDLPAAARRRNVRGAFAVGARPVPRHIALVDDVLTTGSTLGEAARTLQVAGVNRIEFWVAARVGDAGESWLMPEFRRSSA
jgi:ComF family protein